MSDRITVELDDEEVARMDRWRQEVDPPEDREVAAAALIFIGLDEVEGKNCHAGAEVVDTLSLGISAAMKLEADARAAGQSDLAAQAHRIHEMFQELAVYLNTDAGEMAESVYDRLDAVDEAPDRKH
jgi:hypothetical protein